MNSSLPSPRRECCMCGDRGLAYELFQCTACKFRSQHRYCSNLYPKAESYEVCNWCLRTMEEESKEKSHNSPNSSSSNKTNSEEDSKGTNSRKKRGLTDSANYSGRSVKSSSSGGGHQITVKIDSRDTPSKQVKVRPSSPERSQVIRRRSIPRARLDELKPLSDKINNKDPAKDGVNTKGAVNKYSFRNKVRRYKLLDEVSS